MPQTEMSELLSERQPDVLVDSTGGQFSPRPSCPENPRLLGQWEDWCTGAVKFFPI